MGYLWRKDFYAFVLSALDILIHSTFITILCNIILILQMTKPEAQRGYINNLDSDNLLFCVNITWDIVCKIHLEHKLLILLVSSIVIIIVMNSVSITMSNYGRAIFLSFLFLIFWN